MEKKQTAVEWLIEQWPILESQIPPRIIDQAKAMERQHQQPAVNETPNAALGSSKKIEILEGQEFIMNGHVFKWNHNGVGVTITRVGFVPAVFGVTSIVKKKQP